jgi:hypothetical protein
LNRSSLNFVIPTQEESNNENKKQNNKKLRISVSQRLSNSEIMKYTRLTKEQFEALHQEFANFLATQSIDKKEWDELKLNKPQVAEQELDVFSDLIWEGVLAQTNYVEHFSKNHIFLFHCLENEVKSIVLKTLHPEVDFMTSKGLEWMVNNLFSDAIDIHLGKKEYQGERNVAIFDIIQQGAILSDGQLYQQIDNIVNVK